MGDTLDVHDDRSLFAVQGRFDGDVTILQRSHQTVFGNLDDVGRCRCECDPVGVVAELPGRVLTRHDELLPGVATTDGQLAVLGLNLKGIQHSGVAKTLGFGSGESNGRSGDCKSNSCIEQLRALHGKLL